jgi:hypothetical protein
MVKKAESWASFLNELEKIGSPYLSILAQLGLNKPEAKKGILGALRKFPEPLLEALEKDDVIRY